MVSTRSRSISSSKRSARYSALRHADVPWKWPRKLLSGLNAIRVRPTSRSAQVDEIPYIERLSDHWGELCASKEIASTWADRLVGLTRMALSPDKSFRGHFHGTSACLSALYRAERFDELIDLLRVDTIWPYKRWAVRALAAKGQQAEAIRYAESSRSPWASDLEVDSVCEEILLSSGLIDEAYRYGARANRGGTYLATFRAVSKKYPHKPAGEILADLVKTTPGDEGKWFAAAKDVGLYDDALALASRTPCDRWSRSARRRPARRRGVRARHGPGRRSCLRTPTQTQEVRSTMSRPDPIQYADRLYTAIRAANFSPISFLAFGNAVKDGVDFRRMPRMAAEPFMRVVGEMLDLEEEAAQAGEIVDAEVTLGVSAPASTGSASPIPPSPAEEMTPASATTISKPELPASSLPSRRPRDRR